LSSWFSEADLSRARRDTPGCEEILHFNNAGASLMPEPVLDATGFHLRLEVRIGRYGPPGARGRPSSASTTRRRL